MTEQGLIIKATADGVEGRFVVERIDFLNLPGSFMLFRKDTPTTVEPIDWRRVIEITFNGAMVYSRSGDTNGFAYAIINAFVAGGGSEEGAREYVMRNYF